ncbi:hypothetical protein Bbelb_017040 [Branchiostoma belcheri]|nr:hypothetical protein Bbelb_017040 [Branchiostoma belcheri]
MESSIGPKIAQFYRGLGGLSSGLQWIPAAQFNLGFPLSWAAGIVYRPEDSPVLPWLGWAIFGLTDDPPRPVQLKLPALSTYEKECGKVKHTALPADQPPAVVLCTTVCRPKATEMEMGTTPMLCIEHGRPSITAAELPGKEMCGVAGKTDVRGGGSACPV